MKNWTKRIFISDLPNSFTEAALKSSFSQYGEVNSVEIKHRKELGPHNKYPQFAYINLNTDDNKLNVCFKDFKNGKFNNEFIQLQVAKESFLERLKRERLEETQNENSNKKAALFSCSKLAEREERKSFSTASKHERFDEAENSYTDCEKVVPKLTEIDKKPLIKTKLTKESVPETLNDAATTKNEDNIKRLQSIKDMKKNYAAKKNLIRNSLSYSTNSNEINNKIKFDDDDKHEEIHANKVKNSIFDNDDKDGSDFEGNFAVKPQFQGNKGQKLLELQSKFKHDKRFNIDERFIDEEEENNLNGDSSVENEQTEQIKILEQVIGKKVSYPNKSVIMKPMIRYDPLQDNTEDSEIIKKVQEPKKKKVKIVQVAPSSIAPEASKEVFYKVSNDLLKETFTTDKSQFSLLEKFGIIDNEEDENNKNVNEELQSTKLTKTATNGANPFKYDSSSDEEDKEDVIPTKKQKIASNPIKDSSVFWTESFFFKTDDYRLQGLEFIEKLKTVENKEFNKMRQDVKGIVKAKVKNQQRKNKMFKKKLGGSKRRKHVRIKKALKR